jgi:glycogen debranching enzyme
LGLEFISIDAQKMSDDSDASARSNPSVIFARLAAVSTSAGPQSAPSSSLPAGAQSQAVDESPQFAIAVSATLQQRRTHTLKHDDTFAVFDLRGDMGGEAGNSEGLYNRDTRLLSQWQLLFEEAAPLLMSSMTQDDNALFRADLSNPDLVLGGRIVLRRENLQINRMKFVWMGSMYERLLLRNFSDRPLQARLTLKYKSDFADLFEVRGEQRARHGTASVTLEGDRCVAMRYVGLDQVERRLDIGFYPAPTELTTTRASFTVPLKPHQTRRIFMRAGTSGEDVEWTGRVYYHRMRTARQGLRDASSRAAAIDTSNSVFNEIVRRSISDLYMLITDTPQGPYPYAGIPWFSTPFGRDGLITALMMLWVDPLIAKGTLQFLAATQATSIEPERDAEPGKILHEMRHGEMANLHEVPFGRYYGSVDATPLFVLLLGEYFERTSDLDTVRALWPHAEAALEWMDRYGDRDGDGFVEYYRQTKEGLANQGWKDSYDAIFHQNGQTARGAIALCEVQGYVYSAKRHAATLAAALGHQERSLALAAQAESLRERFEATFWCEELGTYALALDGDKNPCRVQASNAGQLLFTGIVSPDRARRVAAMLLSPAMFSGWGVRTVAVSASRYNPMSYHNGSVWPHDNALIALGLARYGQKVATAQLFSALIDAASYMELRRLPELFCGFMRRQRNAPTQYPVACSPQAWASAAPLCVLQAVLGLRLHDAQDEIEFYQPQLPAMLNDVHLRNIRLRRGSADVLLHRLGRDIAATVTRRDGEVVVVVRY